MGPAFLAQQVEHFPCKEEAMGSTPIECLAQPLSAAGNDNWLGPGSETLLPKLPPLSAATE